MLCSRIHLLLLLLFLTIGQVSGQDTISHKYSVYAGYHRGFLIAHRPLVAPLQKGKVNGLELSITQQTSGSQLWHHIYGFPEMGISVSLWDLGNRAMLGKSVAVIPYLDFPLTNGKKVNLDLKFGWGAGYVEKNFDPDKNHKNVAIGSKLNFALILQPHLKWKISNRIHFAGGISLTHYSNGSVASPNLGLNIASITGGLSYQFSQPLTLPEKSLPKLERKGKITIFGALSSKQIYPAEGPNYLAASISANRSWRLTHKSAFGGGADLFYDHSILQKIENREQRQGKTTDAMRAGLHGGYELMIGDVSVIINMGGYLYSKINDGAFYHRFGIRYQMNENIFFCSHIKSHWGKADYIEWGVGYRIDK